MPPTKPVSWTGTRDALAYGPTAPQTTGSARAGALPENEDCLVLNVFTPALANGRGRPVMVWLHGGGFSSGSGSGPILDGTSLARTSDVVVVTINHRLNVFGFTYLGDVAGPEFALSGGAGMLDIVAALEWVRDNIDRFGGDPNLVTIFGQSGGGRKVATLMSMPMARGLFHRAVIESGAVLRLTTREDANHATDLLLAELGLARGQVRELQNVPMAQLLAANAAVNAKLTAREPGQTANSPTVDGKALPVHPWDPAGPAISADIPLLIGYARTEETFYDRPTPEALALDEAGLKLRAARRIGGDPARVIDAFRKAHPDATPWDLWILIATDHPRGTYSRELAKRKAAQAGAPVFLYRFDWETPEGGGHMRSPHTVEIPVRLQQHQSGGPADFENAGGPGARDQGECRLGRVRPYGKSQYARAAEMARVLGGVARHDVVQRHQPRRAGSGSCVPPGDGTGAEAGIIDSCCLATACGRSARHTVSVARFYSPRWPARVRRACRLPSAMPAGWARWARCSRTPTGFASG